MPEASDGGVASSGGVAASSDDGSAFAEGVVSSAGKRRLVQSSMFKAAELAWLLRRR